MQALIDHSRPRLRFSLWAWAWMFLCGCMAPQVVSAVEWVPSSLTSGLKPVLDLSGEWRSKEGDLVEVPFRDWERSEMELSRWIVLPEMEQEPGMLYLYFEALAWEGEIYLDDRLLKVSQDPFSEHLLPLKPEWIRPGGSEIRVRMTREGRETLLYPTHFLGIHRQVHVLVQDPSAPQVRPPEWMLFAPKAVLLSLWSGREVLEDTSLLKKYIYGVFSIPREWPIVLPFRPSNAAMQLLTRSGRPLLFAPEGADSLAFYNAYPLGRKPQVLHPQFWRDANLRPQKAYGSFQSWEDLKQAHSGNVNKIALLSLLLLPVLGLLVIRLGVPRVYDALPEYLRKTKIYLELIGNNKFLKSGQRYLLALIRVVITASIVSLYLFYLNESGGINRLNVLSSNSVLYGFLSGVDLAAYEIFLFTFGGLLIANLLKYIFLNVAGGVFRLNSFSPMIQALDIFSSFPLNLVPVIPLAFLFFVDLQTAEVLLGVWYFLFLAYLIRRIGLIYAGISRLFHFSTSLKFLYICTFEILPWILLL